MTTVLSKLTSLRLTLLFAVLSLAACASTMQSTSIMEAHKHFADQDYERTLELITRAENAKAASPEVTANLTYLRAQTLEQLGQVETARTLYEYVAERHSDTQYGYLARQRLANPS